MRIDDHFSQAGQHLFRWRSYLPLIFLPLFVYAAFQGEVLEHSLGSLWGDGIEVFGILLVVAGEALRIMTVGFVPARTSGRNVGGQVASTLNTTGVYSLVRNPLYLGNCMMYLGVAVFSQNLFVATIVGLALIPYYERIIAAEERFLMQKFGATYADWVARTPAFLPRLAGFVPPSMPFSLRTVIRREQASILAAVAALYLMESGLHTLGREAEPMPAAWHWLMALAVVLFVVAQIAKKRRLLAVDGR